MIRAHPKSVEDDRLAAEPRPHSVSDLASMIDEPALAPIRALYSIRRLPASRLYMDSIGWKAAARATGMPRRAVEQQVVVAVRERFTAHETMFNPLRNRRTATAGASVAAAVPRDAATVRPCLWCGDWHVRNASLWSEDWDQAWSDDHRAGSRPNWARQALISGLVFGDDRMHELHALSEAEFTGLFEAAERYVERARRHHAGADYFLIYVNGGPKSGGSVEHAHAQVVGRQDCHFAYPELVATCCPTDYWHRLLAAHRQLGLSVALGNCAAWASLAPRKERDLTAISDTITDGARFLYRCWKALAVQGTQNFSLAAIVSPAYFVGHRVPVRFAGWPKVVWRFVDRGDPRVGHGDIGTMELFGSAIVGTDPFDVAQWLARAFPTPDTPAGGSTPAAA